jgi:hypothetical protein
MRLKDRYQEEAMKKIDVLKALRDGERVLVTHPDAFKAGEKASCTLTPSGRTVGVRCFRAILEDLRPVGDGLFGAEISQSYELVGGE